MKRVLLAAAALALAAAPSFAETKVSAYWNQLFQTTTDPDTAKMMNALEAEYKKLKPDVTINNVDYMPDVNAYQAWLVTRFAAGDQPDVAWQQFQQRNMEKGNNWLALNKYLDEPNPYVPAGQPGHDRWLDLFFPNVLAQIRAGDGNWYQ